MPSACGAFTSACCLSSVRMAARSDFSAASANRDARTTELAMTNNNPMAMLDKSGVPLDKLGDSTGELVEL